MTHLSSLPFTFGRDFHNEPPLVQRTLLQALYSLLHYNCESHIESGFNSHQAFLTSPQKSDVIMNFDHYTSDHQHRHLRGVTIMLMLVINPREKTQLAINFSDRHPVSIVNLIEKYAKPNSEIYVGETTLWYPIEYLHNLGRVPVDQDVRRYNIKKPGYYTWEQVVKLLPTQNQYSFIG